MTDLEMAKEAGFEIVEGTLNLYIIGNVVRLHPNKMGTVVDGLKAFANIVRQDYIDKAFEQHRKTMATWYDSESGTFK